MRAVGWQMTDYKYNDNLCKQDDPIYAMRIEINALKAELAIYKAHQEPIGYLSPSGKFYKTRIMAVSNYEQLAQPVYADPVQPSPPNNYQATFYAIADAAKQGPKGIHISVEKFWESYNAAVRTGGDK